MEEEYTVKWNWGAFMYWMFFAIANRTYLAFLNLIPIFNFFWIFWTAAHAEKWALDANDYRDNEEFRKVMDSWNHGGFVMFFIMIAFFVLYFLFFASVFSAAFSLMANS